MLDLQLFSAVVEARSFSAAALARGTTTSAASKRVARLEGLLGVRLLERTTRRVLPTDAGAAFYAVPRASSRTSAKRRTRSTRSAANRVRAHVDSSLARVKVGQAAGIVVAAPSYLERMGKPETPRDLARHNGLRFTNVTAAREWLFRSKRGDVTVPVRGNFHVNHGGGLREAVISGIGIARMPELFLADAVAKKQSVPLSNRIRWRRSEFTSCITPRRRTTGC